MISAAAFSLSAAIALSAGAASVPSRDPDCHDDRGVDRCSQEAQARMHSLYGVRSIEDHRNAGDQVRRVFYVDGYGRDLVLIAFVRSPGRDPSLRVHYSQRAGQPQPETFEAPVAQSTWNEVLNRSENFHRTFAPIAGDDPDRWICLHSWVYTIEAVGERRPRRDAEIRRKVEDACEQGPGSEYAEELATIALSLVPHCAAIDLRQHRNAATVLDVCRLLHGDRLAAAEVLNRAAGFRQIGGRADAHRITGRFAHETRIDWNGLAFRGPGHQADEFWAGQLDRPGGVTNLYIERIEGEGADRVRLLGGLSRSVDTPRGRGTGYEHARVEQLWVRDFNGEMRVESATIGPWEPVRQR